LITQHQFVSAGAKYAVKNPRDLRSDEYRKKWQTWFNQTRAAFAPASADLLAIVARTADPVMTIDDNGIRVTDASKSRYGVWLEGTLDAFLKAEDRAPEEWRSMLNARLDLLVKMMRDSDPNFDKSLDDLAASFLTFAALRRDLE